MEKRQIVVNSYNRLKFILGEFTKEHRLVLYALLGVVVFGSIYWLFYDYGHSVVFKFESVDEKGGQSFERAGQFGDSFGYINALFSGLAFAGVILALFVQIAEFHLAESERKDSIEIQRQISDQQTLNSVISSINTWRSLNPHMGYDRATFTRKELRRIHRRFVNLILLEIAQGNAIGTLDGTSNQDSIRESMVRFRHAEQVAKLVLRVSIELLGLFDKFLDRFDAEPQDADIAWHDEYNQLLEGLQRMISAFDLQEMEATNLIRANLYKAQLKGVLVLNDHVSKLSSGDRSSVLARTQKLRKIFVTLVCDVFEFIELSDYPESERSR